MLYEPKEYCDEEFCAVCSERFSEEDKEVVEFLNYKRDCLDLVHHSCMFEYGN